MPSSLSQLSHWVKKVVEYDPMNQQGNQYFLFIGSDDIHSRK